MSDPRGHGFGQPHVTPQPLDSNDPAGSLTYLSAVDLFNAGYYWEAHEALEGLWIAAGRRGMQADFLKGLIKLAAAGVKAREGVEAGVQRHARRAGELFESVRGADPSSQAFFCGLLVQDLIAAARSIAENPKIDQTPSIEGLPVLSIQWKLCGVDSV